MVLPDGDRCFYCDLPGGPAYEKALVHDLVPYVDHVFPTVAAREGRVIGGLSMGGYGAIEFALKYPELFCGATSHSGAFGAVRQGDRGLPPEDCPFRLAEALDKSRAPALRFDCGLDDQLLAHDRDLHTHLEALRIAHEYDEFPGGHTWDYSDLHVQEAVRFHCRVLGIPQGES